MDAPNTDRALEWDIATDAEALHPDYRVRRMRLADAARTSDWDTVLALLDEDRTLVNTARPGGRSRYTVLHQAAYHGAPPRVVEELLRRGALRLMRTADGELPVDVARRRGSMTLLPALEPQPKLSIAEPELARMEIYLHAAILGRARRQVEQYRVRLPRIEPLLEVPGEGLWVPIPGMYGGFLVWLVRGDPRPLLATDSWCRVADGSEQRHLVTPDSLVLVDPEAPLDAT